MKDIHRRLGDQIRMARTESGMTQGDLAAALSSAESTIGHWESGRGNPRPKTLRQVAKIFRKPVSFFTGDPKDDLLSVADLPSDRGQTPATGSARQDEPNPFDVDHTDMEVVGSLADALQAVKASRQELRLISTKLRDLDNSMLALESRLQATLGGYE